jgi:hypothetical protein
MHLRYDDILNRVSHRPLWWLDGVPRYDPFSPCGVGGFEVALVHTECQDCRTRYEVAVRPRQPLFWSLRDMVAYMNSLDVGDPPNACRSLGSSNCSAGYCMSSLEISILEFWHRSSLMQNWQRDCCMERPLVDTHYHGVFETESAKPVFLRIYESDRNNEWRQAQEEGNFPLMVDILTAFDCERPKSVAHMLDLERRDRLVRNDIAAVRKHRLGVS